MSNETKLDKIIAFLVSAAKRGTEESSKRVIAMGSSVVLWAALGFFALVAWYQVCTAPQIDTALRDIIIAIAASIAVLAGAIGRKNDSV